MSPSCANSALLAICWCAPVVSWVARFPGPSHGLASCRNWEDAFAWRSRGLSFSGVVGCALLSARRAGELEVEVGEMDWGDEAGEGGEAERSSLRGLLGWRREGRVDAVSSCLLVNEWYSRVFA